MYICKNCIYIYIHIYIYVKTITSKYSALDLYRGPDYVSTIIDKK